MLYGRMYSIRQWLVTGLALAVATACSNDPTGVDDPANGGSNTGGSNTSQLNFFEEELVGTWYRFHSFDGSDQYYRFNADRTACKWEEPSGSDSRVSRSSYSNWSVSDSEEPAGTGRYRVSISGSGLTNGLTFDYPDDELFPTDFTNLRYSPSSSGKTCE